MLNKESRILYSLNVSWSWIEQRPHILANELSKYYEVVAIAPKSVLRTLLRSEKQLSNFSGVSRSHYVLPSSLCGGIAEKLMRAINDRGCYRDVEKFDCLWLSHPKQIQYLPSTYSGKIVYDCMDDHASMVPSAEREELRKLEKALLKRADVVFVTSVYLKKMIGRDDAVLVRNGYKQGNLCPISGAAAQPFHTIAYFGTVSQWFDFDAVGAVVQRLSNISFRIIGPTEVRRDIDRVEYTGPVKHQELFDSVSDCSCLIMPFKVNDIIKAVDPVKLYEYIAFGKCVISVRYPEVERFGDYVYFYESADELVELIKDLADKGFPPKYTEESRTAFLRSNTWESRVKTIVVTLAKHGIIPR